MTILDEIQTSIRQHAAGESAAPPQLGIAIAPRRVARRLRRADERTVQVAFTPEIEGK